MNQKGNICLFVPHSRRHCRRRRHRHRRRCFGVFGTSNLEVLFVKLAVVLFRAMIMKSAVTTLEATQSSAIFQAMGTFGLGRQIKGFFESVDLALDHVDADGPNYATFVQPNLERFRFRIGDDSHRV